MSHLFEDELLERMYNEYLCARIDRAKLLGSDEMKAVEDISPEAVLIMLLQKERNRILDDIRRLKDQKKGDQI
ncbi:MAG: hypothetical protein J6C00_13255 [Eubacterium sp.]|nr:hypothetical protein [Eubacterium sp.]